MSCFHHASWLVAYSCTDREFCINIMDCWKLLGFFNERLETAINFHHFRSALAFAGIAAWLQIFVY
jgi:hypothetical protein